MAKEKVKKPFYKKWWVWVLAIIIIGSIATSGEEEPTETASTEPATEEKEPAAETKAEETATPVEVKKEEPAKEDTKVEDDVPQEYKSALKKAESYAKSMNMSKSAIFGQLTSEYGEKFSAESAQYAIDNLQFDWNANALKKAESYSKTMHMSKQGIYEQLIF